MHWISIRIWQSIGAFALHGAFGMRMKSNWDYLLIQIDKLNPHICDMKCLISIYQSSHSLRTPFSILRGWLQHPVLHYIICCKKCMRIKKNANHTPLFANVLNNADSQSIFSALRTSTVGQSPEVKVESFSIKIYLSFRIYYKKITIFHRPSWARTSTPLPSIQ